MKNFWDERYGQEEYVYGTDPNRFLANVLGQLKPGKILFPADGEGRNSVYAAQGGWDVFAFDWSSAGKLKADKLAESKGVRIDYRVCSINALPFPEDSFDTVALIYTHFPGEQKEPFLRNVIRLLKSGGVVIMEVFSKGHIAYQKENPGVGGPRDEDLLYSMSEVQQIFHDFTTESLIEEEIELREGKYHNGKGLVIRLIARKK